MMKINKIHIGAFGKLSNFDLVLNDGFNLIYGDNEYGKTTLMTFIKMVFFGTAGGKAGLDRKKYIPWSGEKYAGSIDFTKDGVPYRIEREFAATNSHDKISLINLNTSQISEVSPKEPLGEKLFGCTLACFERTLFIGTLNDSDTENSVLGEINGKLSNIVSSGEEDVSVNTVSNNLLSAKHRFLSKGGKIGICDKAKLKAEQIKETLINEKLQYAEKERHLSELEEMKTQLDAMDDKESELKSELKISQGLERLKALREFVSCCEELEVLEKRLTLKDGTLLSQKDILTLKEKQTKIKATKNAIEQKSALLQSNSGANDSDALFEQKMDNLCSVAEQLKKEIMQKEDYAEKLRVKAKVKFSPLAALFCAVAILLIATGVVLGNATSLLLYCGATVAFFIFAVSQISAIKKSHRSHSDYIDICEEILNRKENLQEISNQITILSQKKEQSSELKLFAIKQNEEELLSLKAELANLQSDYLLFFSALPEVHGADDDEKTERLSSLLMDLNTLKSKYQALNIGLGGITADLAKRALIQAAEQSGDTMLSPVELEEKIDILRKERSLLSEEYHRLENAVSVKYHSLHVPAVLQRQLDELNSEIKKQEEFCLSVDIALQVLEEASDEMQSSWGSELNSRVSELFSRITGEKYGDVLVNKSLGISAEEKGIFGFKSTENLSAGTKDQSYFSLRLALCDLIFGKDTTFPVFLDDSFERYDDTRAKRALEFLKEFCEERQILFFTCHKNLENLLKG